MEEVARKWIEKMGKDGPLASQAIYALAITGIQVKSCQPGFILCKFVVPKHLSVSGPHYHTSSSQSQPSINNDHTTPSWIMLINHNPVALQGLKYWRNPIFRVWARLIFQDKKGNWQVGAITALIDIIGAMATLLVTGHNNVSVQFDISYFSMAKISEEMEIESRVLAHKGKLSAVTVEIRKKGSGEMVALGNQWMSSSNREQSKL